MNKATEELLKSSIVAKCKVHLACMFQGDTNSLVLNEYELAYIIEKLREKDD